MRLAERCLRLDQLLTVSARRHPDRDALSDGARCYTHAELDTEVEGLTEALVAAGVKPGDRVGVLLPKGVDAVLAVHAALRAGAVVAPLDVSDPPERAARKVHSAGLAFLLTPPHPEAAAPVAERVPGTGAPAVRLGPRHGLRPLAATGPLPEAADGGYILFTSGSTGWPKGVLLTHGNVLHFAYWAAQELDLAPWDRIGSQSALTFDLSTFDLFGSLVSGACLCLLPEVLKPFPRDVVGWLRDERISVFYAVPTLYQALLHQGGIAAAALPQLRTIAFAGEPFPVPDLRRYTELFPEADFYNLYGPTETNVCTFDKLPADWDPAQGLSIGRALPGLRVEFTDQEHQVRPDAGEIAVFGPAVSAGYLQGGELHEHTVPVRLPDGGRERAYLTGDLGHRGADGRIRLRGRRDHQVKRRGYRIDLLDIESVVLECPAVRSCAAVWVPDAAGSGQIRLHAVAPGASAAELRGWVADALPPYLAPDRTVLADRLPLTERGKIDREALAAADPDDPPDRAEPAEPAEPAAGTERTEQTRRTHRTPTEKAEEAEHGQRR